MVDLFVLMGAFVRIWSRDLGRQVIDHVDIAQY